MNLLVSDASPWVDFLSGRECLLLETALQAGSLGLPAMVKLELLGNELPGKERRSLEKALHALPLLGTDPGHFLRAGRLKAQLKQKGVLLSARDAHVLQCALDNGGILISRDPLFQRIQKSAGVQVQLW